MPRRLNLLLLLPLLPCLAGGCCVADRLVLGQNHAALDPAGAGRRVVTAAGGRAVECWVARSPGAMSAASNNEPAAFVLLFVGRGARVDPWVVPVAESWGDRPVEVWGVNHPGFGGTDGPGRLDLIVPDALAVY